MKVQLSKNFKKKLCSIGQVGYGTFFQNDTLDLLRRRNNDKYSVVHADCDGHSQWLFGCDEEIMH